MTQIQMAAQRREAIINTLKASPHPLTVDDLYEKPHIKELCKGKYNVSDDLKSMRGKEVYKVPSNKSSHQYAYTVFKPSLTAQHRHKLVKAIEDTRPPVDQVKDGLIDGLDTLKVFLSDDEYLGFLKGALIMFPEYKTELLC
jgi:hypothetical protein